MYRTYRNPFERPCDCRCPIHQGSRRTAYDEPDCHCLITCASQPATLIVPEVGGILFLDYGLTLWFVPSLEPGHWDWQCAVPVGSKHPLGKAADHLSDLLFEAHEALLPLIHRM
jgi:hypothetical protein